MWYSSSVMLSLKKMKEKENVFAEVGVISNRRRFGRSTERGFLRASSENRLSEMSGKQSNGRDSFLMRRAYQSKRSQSSSFIGREKPTAHYIEV